MHTATLLALATGAQGLGVVAGADVGRVSWEAIALQAVGVGISVVAVWVADHNRRTRSRCIRARKPKTKKTQKP